MVYVGPIWFVMLLAAEVSPTVMDRSVSEYRDRMIAMNSQAAEEPSAVTEPVAQARSGGAPRKALVVQPGAIVAPDSVLTQMPDPTDAGSAFEATVERLRKDTGSQQDQRVVRNAERVLEESRKYLGMVHRPLRRPLGLAECVQRALDNNYTIRIQAHNPAIAQTQIVEAEAAFDTEFFLDTNYANRDAATATSFSASTSQNYSMQGGLRQLLPTGAQASVAISHTRSQNNLPQQFQTLNPVWQTTFTTTLSQPLLRGFGLDVNRAPIIVAQIGQKISTDEFIQNVRDTLFNVEQAYWSLVNARRTASIRAWALAQYYVTWQNMVERLEHDATQVEVANAEAQYRTAYANFLEDVKNIRTVEDQLVNLMNDPTFTLSSDLEIIPTEVLNVAPRVIDQFAEVRTAIDRRSEVTAAKRRIEQARVNTNVAKNEILPQLNVTFQYETQGLAGTADNSFDDLRGNDYISYTVGVNFAYSFGERRARAKLRRSQLQESQAVVGLQQVTDAVVQDVNERVRDLMLRYAQIAPRLLSADAAERNLRALQARTQQINPSFLQTELQGVEQLAGTRVALLGVVTQYNIGLVELEKAKGTLLDYNNVAVVDVRSRR